MSVYSWWVVWSASYYLEMYVTLAIFSFNLSFSPCNLRCLALVLTLWRAFVALQFQQGHLPYSWALKNLILKSPHIYIGTCAPACLFFKLILKHSELLRTCSGRSIQPIKATATEMPPTVLSMKPLFCIQCSLIFEWAGRTREVYLLIYWFHVFLF